MHLVFPYMSSINRRHLLAPPGATLEWRPLSLSQWIDLFDLTGIVLPSGTTCQLSTMIDCPHPPPWGVGGGGGERAPRFGGGVCGPPGSPQFLNAHLILRCKYETRIPSKKERIRMIHKL